MYHINDIGIEQAKFMKKESLKMLIGGPIYSIIMVLLVNYKMSNSKASVIYFADSFLIFLMSLLFIYAPF